MGRLLSLLLFGLLLYNMMGYSVVYLLEAQYTPSGASPAHVERNAFSKDIVVKVPFSLPYQVSWSHPEPSQGKVEHEGEYYQIRTTQLVNDTMYVYCEYDQNARDRYMELVDHIQDEMSQPSPRSHSKLLKSLTKEFMATPRTHLFFVLEWIETTPTAQDQYCAPVSHPSYDITAPPPDSFLILRS